MQAPQIPENEKQRIATLHALGVLDTPNEERFDRVTRLAQHMFDVPIALVSLIDEDRQWFKSHQGLDTAETPREFSFCGHAILGDGAFVVRDATSDERFADNPLVTGAPNIRFYAGCPLQAADGHKLGTLCLIDDRPRDLSDDQQIMLRDLADVVERELMALHVAMLDDLTGLSNRRGFISIGTKAFSICKRLNRPAHLLYFDIEHLDAINDAHGEASGDRALWEFAEHLREVFRASDVVARIDADEFCVLLTGTEDGEKPLSRLRGRIDARNGEPMESFVLGYAVGAAHLDAERHGSLGDLVSEAESAMRASKSA